MREREIGEAFSLPTRFFPSIMNPVRRFATRHDFSIFCGLAFAAGLPVFAYFPAAPPALQFPLLIAGSYAPALAAFITTSLMADAQGRSALMGRIRLRQVSRRWYFFALLVPTVTCLGVFLGFNLGRGAAWLWSLVAFPAVFLANFGEEIGWRGFALPRLLQSYSAFKASLLLGLVWTAYHAPLYWNQPLEGLLLLGPILPLSVLITWFFLASGGSLLVCALFHAAFNTWILALATPTSTAPLLIGQIIVYAAIAVAIRIRNGPSLVGKTA